MVCSIRLSHERLHPPRRIILSQHGMLSAERSSAWVASELTISGSNFLEDRSECRECGKQSGLDDFVHNALYAGIHSADFMKDFILSGAGKNVPFSEHELTCSRCVTKHEGTKSWLAFPPWPS